MSAGEVGDLMCHKGLHFIALQMTEETFAEDDSGPSPKPDYDGVRQIALDHRQPHWPYPRIRGQFIRQALQLSQSRPACPSDSFKVCMVSTTSHGFTNC